MRQQTPARNRRTYDEYIHYLNEVREKTSAGLNAFESQTDRHARIERAKTDPLFFLNYYLPHYQQSPAGAHLVDALDRWKANPTIKELDQWGRAMAKSIAANVYWPLYGWLCGEVNYHVTVSINGDKAEQLLSDLQAEFEANQRIIADFGEQVLDGNWADGFFQTRSGFIAQALGIGQSVRGLRVKAQRPDSIVIDDPDDRLTVKNLKLQKEKTKWVRKALIPCMDGPRRRLIVCENYFDEQTITGILQQENPTWSLVRISACDPVTHEPTWPEKNTKQYFDEIESEIGTLAFNSEFCNEPHTEGTVFLDEYFQWLPADQFPKLTEMDVVKAFWDVAYSGTGGADFNSIEIWGMKKKQFYHIASFCLRCKLEVAFEWLALFVKEHRSLRFTCFYEQIHAGAKPNFMESKRKVEAKHKVQLPLVVSQIMKGDKIDRIIDILNPMYQSGRIWYCEASRHNAHLKMAIAQLKAVEPGSRAHDDAPDAQSQCLHRMNKASYTYGSPPPRTAKGYSRKSEY